MPNLEQKVYEVGAVTSPNGEVNGRIALVTAAGAPLPGSQLPALPTSNGQYGLQVTGGVYTWTAVT